MASKKKAIEITGTTELCSPSALAKSDTAIPIANAVNSLANGIGIS